MAGSLLELCSAKNFDNTEFWKLFEDANEKLEVNASDKEGMTVVMHAAYNGHIEACRKLVAMGADVNRVQKDGYSALMFAAISGQCGMVELLLGAGARTSMTNNLGKTAANMAAFIGQHECAQVINNYISLEELQSYVGVVARHDEPHLPVSLATPLHSLFTSTKIHPVKLLLALDGHPDLLQASSQVCHALRTLSLQLINKQLEGLALKAHYLAYLVDLAHKHGSSRVISKMLVCTEAGEWVEMDLLLRQCLQEYPHIHTTLLHQMVASLAKTKPGQAPSTYSIFVSAIIGEKGAEAVADSCCVCGEHGSLKKCSNCKKVSYCSISCQKLAWSRGNHKTLCRLWTTST